MTLVFHTHNREKQGFVLSLLSLLCACAWAQRTSESLVTRSDLERNGFFSTTKQKKLVRSGSRTGSALLRSWTVFDEPPTNTRHSPPSPWSFDWVPGHLPQRISNVACWAESAKYYTDATRKENKIQLPPHHKSTIMASKRATNTIQKPKAKPTPNGNSAPKKSKAKAAPSAPVAKKASAKPGQCENHPNGEI